MPPNPGAETTIQRDQFKSPDTVTIANLPPKPSLTHYDPDRESHRSNRRRLAVTVCHTPPESPNHERKRAPENDPMAMNDVLNSDSLASRTPLPTPVDEIPHNGLMFGEGDLQLATQEPKCKAYAAPGLPSNTLTGFSNPMSAGASLNTRVDELKPFVIELIRDTLNTWPDVLPVPPNTPSGYSATAETSPGPTPGRSAQKPGFKKVMEVWNEKLSRYITVEPVKSSLADDLNQYVFTAREFTKKYSDTSTTYIDVKSNELRDILRGVLRDVRATSLMEERPSIEQNILFHFLPELKNHAEKLQGEGEVAANGFEHLLLLIEYVSDTYAATKQHLESLLKCGQITYPLLWTLFKPGCHVYTTCLGSGKSRCVIFDAGDNAKEKGVYYFNMECRYLDHDGQVFGEAGTELGIVKFRGAKKIHSLDAFPLQYHPDHKQVRDGLIECGRKFCEIISGFDGNPMLHLHHCKGNAFITKARSPIRLNIDSWVAIDAAFFREMEPNYGWPRVFDSWENHLAYHEFDVDKDQRRKDIERLKYNGIEAQGMGDSDLLVCCPTVCCFSFNEKCFLECAVADLHGVEWLETAFDHLQVPDDTRQILLSLATSRLGHLHMKPFDDLIQRKGRGLNILLHGPLGVGKTFTVEATAEQFKLPLYSILAGELVLDHGDPLQLEAMLDQIFKIAKHYNAVLLLDEADMFMEKRTSFHDAQNRLVTVFLCKLKYYEGIFFLTTNHLVEFDDAVLSRIHLKMKYEGLTREA
ncbi:hypothetical protein LOZ58_006845 [Ophidiomyces ophidiicola]|nr:hypothetical protein LOZ58_006845 [Ophidiomyces ophidiicola]